MSVIRYDRPVTWGMAEPAYLWRAVRAAEIRRGLSHAQLAEIAGVTEHSIEELSIGRGACALVLLRLEDWLLAEVPCSCGRAASQLSTTGVPCCDDHAHLPHRAADRRCTSCGGLGQIAAHPDLIGSSRIPCGACGGSGVSP